MRILIIEPNETVFEFRRSSVLGKYGLMQIDAESEHQTIKTDSPFSGCVIEHARTWVEAFQHLRIARELDTSLSHYDVVSISGNHKPWYWFDPTVKHVRRLAKLGKQVTSIVAHTENHLLDVSGGIQNFYTIREVCALSEINLSATIEEWALFCLDLASGERPLEPGSSPQIDLTELREWREDSQELRAA
jgi:hypothetical protein